MIKQAILIALMIDINLKSLIVLVDLSTDFDTLNHTLSLYPRYYQMASFTLGVTKSLIIEALIISWDVPTSITCHSHSYWRAQQPSIYIYRFINYPCTYNKRVYPLR